MANSRKKDVIFVDTIGSIVVDALKPVLYAIMITPNAVDSRVVMKESASGTVVLDVKIEAVETRYLSFEAIRGIELNTTFEITTLTNIDSVLLYGNWKQPVGRAR